MTTNKLRSSEELKKDTVATTEKAKEYIKQIQHSLQQDVSISEGLRQERKGRSNQRG